MYASYDDRWLREVLNRTREDLLEHRQDDKDQHAALRDELEHLNTQFKQLIDVLSFLSFIGKGVRWLTLILVGAGGATYLAKMVVQWLGKS